MKKAIVVRSKNSATMILECGACWLAPDKEMLVEETLGQLIAGKYGLETAETSETLDGPKWAIRPKSKDLKVVTAPKKDSSTVEDKKSTKDMGSKAGKKKTSKKKAASK